MPTPSGSGHRFDLVVSDIDGCLQSEGSHPMDLAALGQIAGHNRRANETGDVPKVTLCSGRPQPFAEAMCKFLRIENVPCVSENGAWLYRLDRNEYLLDPTITPDHLAAVREASAWVRATLGPKGVTEQPGKTASVSLYHPDTTYLRSLEGPVREEFAKRGWPMRISMTWLYINCDLAHISKGTGMERLMKLTGTSPDRLAGIGDTLSDVPIRERVAFFGCPANAAPGIKERADYVSPFEEARGVVDILERISRM